VEEFLAEVEAGSPHHLAQRWYSVRAQIRLGSDDVAGALADAEHALEAARLSKDPTSLSSALAVSAHVFRESGSLERAAPLAGELLAELRTGTTSRAFTDILHTLAWTVVALGRGQELVDILPSDEVPWIQAAVAFAAGDLRQAADLCGAMGALTEEARDRLWLAEALIEQNRRAEADVELQRALAFYHSVGATRYIRESARLLAASA
jgi:hypothetical protein